jgi:tRNA dimethylallyltransferase
MISAGAIEEVRALGALGLDPALPAMRAHGVPELLAHLDGRMTLEAASERAILNTGQYTKRQATWFRHHGLGDPSLVRHIVARYTDTTTYSESLFASFAAFVGASR